MKLVLLGAPSAGKGTQAEIISRKLCVPAISTGSMLRDAVKNETPVGLKAKSYMESGKLVPDDVVLGIVIERLERPDCKNGCILDGVPRTIAQAKALEDAGIDIDVALELAISDEEAIRRLTGRRVCGQCSTTYNVVTNPPKKGDICDSCQGELVIREDDEPETVKKRLKVYHEETEPLIEFYKSRGKLVSVDNLPTIEATAKVIFRALGI